MHTFLLPILTLTLILSCQTKQHELGTKQNPIKIYFTPSADTEAIAIEANEFARFLEKETGHYVEAGVPTSYIAVVEALGSHRADVAVMNSFAYLLANERYGANAKFTVIRHGSESYKGQIIVHKDSGIKTLKDLQDKNVAFVDSTSTSGYLFPLKMLKDANVTPKNIIFSGKHDNVVTAVYQKAVHAGATFYSEPSPNGDIRDARSRVLTQFPDVAEKVQVLAITPPIRNNLFAYRKDLPAKIQDKLSNAITRFLSTEEGKTAFRKIYDAEGIVPTTDSDYDSLRTLVSTLALDTKSLAQ